MLYSEPYYLYYWLYTNWKNASFKFNILFEINFIFSIFQYKFLDYYSRFLSYLKEHPMSYKIYIFGLELSTHHFSKQLICCLDSMSHIYDFCFYLSIEDINAIGESRLYNPLLDEWFIARASRKHLTNRSAKNQSLVAASSRWLNRFTRR